MNNDSLSRKSRTEPETIARNVLNPQRCQQFRHDLESDIQQLFGKFCAGDIHGYESQVYSCLAPMGSAVCFNNRVWHRGSPNNSERPRYITQITYATRLVGHKYYPFINYQMPEHCYQNANPRLKRLLGFLSHGAYG